MAQTREADAFLPILRGFGVPGDGVLVVHSAIGTLSRQGFRAEAMIKAFLDHMKNGNLFMPTMTWRTVLPDKPNWDELETPSHTGVLSEIFRTRYSTHRSIHPTHSVAGHGPAAATLLSRHQIDDTPVSQNSPYGLMRDYEAYVLTIGCGLETVTAIHLPEETIDVDLYVRLPETAAVYPCRDRHGTVHPVTARRHYSLNRDFPKFSAPLQQQGALVTGNILGCPYTLVSLRALLRHVFAALIADPRATLKDT
ncbi:MAG: AAC(3) family N-acetyltransferase [Proteobacteria bacterium]|nr:AAC(3) family N-acetyltransferase [Pseudomonadota bacterium]